MDEIKTYKDFGLNKKQGLYCEYRIQNYNKRKSYMKAFNVENEDLASTEVWKMEQKVGDKLKALELYGKSIGAFVENINVDAKVEQVVFENEDDIPE